jgi:hypothetical protein
LEVAVARLSGWQTRERHIDIVTSTRLRNTRTRVAAADPDSSLAVLRADRAVLRRRGGSVNGRKVHFIGRELDLDYTIR